MRLTQRNKRHHPIKVPRIEISQEEILADLLYPAGRRAWREAAATRPRRSG